MAFAGLWERWTIPDGIRLPRSLADRAPGDAVESCTILTTSANETLAPVHHRMPLILPTDDFDPWLAGEPVALDPYPADTMIWRGSISSATILICDSAELYSSGAAITTNSR